MGLGSEIKMQLFQTATILTLCGISLFSINAQADNGPLGIDHKITSDNSGIWSRKNQLALQTVLIGGVAITSLWEGTDDPLGKIAWQSIDSMLVTALIVQPSKRLFSRARPNESDDPNDFFQGHGHESFPSGEVSNVAAIVTPFALEYGPAHPWVYAASTVLVMYDGAARIKVQGHWLSDVLVGAAIGVGSGYLMHQRSSPLVLLPFGKGVIVGVKWTF